MFLNDKNISLTRNLKNIILHHDLNGFEIMYMFDLNQFLKILYLLRITNMYF